MAYRFTGLLELSLYGRNLLRTDKTEEFKMDIMYLSVELKSTFRFSPNVEAYMGLTYKYTGRAASKSLGQSAGEFTKGEAKDTNDYVSVIQIPAGITIKLQAGED